MKNRLLVLLLSSSIVTLSACNSVSSSAVAINGSTHEQILLQGSKKASIKATYYPARAPKATLLLFHQAGADESEYRDIVPRLLEQGYSALTVDQAGGGLFSNFADGLPDMRAALTWAQDKEVPVIIWGSSYSASLAYLLAAESPDRVAAVLAFSGGDYLEKGEVASAVAQILVPIFATSSKDEVAEMRQVLNGANPEKITFFVPNFPGIHGSGTLSSSKNAEGSEEAWTAVLAFLDKVVASPALPLE